MLTRRGIEWDLHTVHTAKQREVNPTSQFEKGSERDVFGEATFPPVDRR
jgi:hypothetical protein